MKILILWASLADYTVACFKKLSLQTDTEIMLIYQPVNSNAPFSGFDLSFCHSSFEDRTETRIEYIKAIDNYKPDAIFMASWNFGHYMQIARKYKNSGTYVLSAFDNQWQNTFKQKLGIISSKWFLKPAIDNFLVPGDRQAQFAVRLGYPQPYTGFYCANTTNFENINYNPDTHNFLFIGRLIEQKGVSNLITAYKSYRQQVENPWGLIVAGSGHLRSKFENVEGISMRSFVQPNELSKLMNEASCFVLPSLHENWGLVIHEAALSKQPIICTINCGASTWFVRDGQNGHIIDTSTESLMAAFKNMHNLSSDKLKAFSEFSFNLGHMWTVDKWATYINDILKHNIKSE